MTKPSIYIDGQEGTTGLRIRTMLERRQDLELLLIPAAQRKDTGTRRSFLNRADLVILCLPDEAATEALELIDNPATRIIDTSTIRRINPGWIYGLPELGPGQREAIVKADRVANCGCYPVGFTLAVRPLIQAGLLDPGAQFTINAISGYSGGGRKMIEAYGQAPRPDRSNDAALPLSLYSLGESHKHVPEMQAFGLLEHPPLFVPSVAHTYCGMLVSTPLTAAHCINAATTAQAIHAVWQACYRDAPFVRPVAPTDSEQALREGKFLDPGECNFTNRVELFVFGNPAGGLLLVGRLDNLGKGASGNAVQCLNLMLGFDEKTGLST